MNPLKIKSTKFSPEICFDPQNNILEFYGFCLPENALEFFQPIIDWLNDYKEKINKSIHFPEVKVIFKFTYYNSASLRRIIEIFSIFSEMYHRGVPIIISWQYDSEDLSMAESGKEISEISNIPINLVSYN